MKGKAKMCIHLNPDPCGQNKAVPVWRFSKRLLNTVNHAKYYCVICFKQDFSNRPKKARELFIKLLLALILSVISI